MRIHARLALTTLLTLAIATGAGLVATSPATAATWAPRATDSFDPQTDLDEFESRVLIRVNQVRKRRGLPRVRVFQSCVDRYAERWSRRLTRLEKLEHRSLGAVLDGCKVNWVGENLVRGTGLRPDAAVRAWMQSPPHRRVLLKRRASWAGIGARVGGDGRTYVVLNFADRT